MLQCDSLPPCRSMLTYQLHVQSDHIAVIVGAVTDDVRIFDVPEMKVAALRFTRTARARITEVQPDCPAVPRLQPAAPELALCLCGGSRTTAAWLESSSRQP